MINWCEKNVSRLWYKNKIKEFKIFLLYFEISVYFGVKKYYFVDELFKEIIIF